MKKGLIITAALAMVLGVGAAVGAHQAEAIKTKAASVSTVYCKVTQSWWTADGAAVGAYCWNGEDDSQKNAAWPGERMTAVGGQTGLWTYTVPNGYDKVIFTRVNPSGDIADWGAKTADQSIPSVKNCFTITSESAVWGNPGAVGYWSVYPEVAPEYHLLGTFNEWNDPDDDYILTVDAQDSNHYTISDVVLGANAEVKVCDVKNDDWYGDHGSNVVASEAGTYDVDFYVHADNEINVVLNKQAVEPTYTIVNRNNAPVQFELDEDEKPEGVLHQYSAEVQYACRGGELKFYANGVQITSNIGVDAGDEEHINNVYGNTTDGFRIRHTSNYFGDTKVYLKTYADGGYSIWGEGFDTDTYCAQVKTIAHGDATGYDLNLDETYEPNETYIEQYKTSSPVAIKALSGEDEYTSNEITCAGLLEDLIVEDVAGNNAKTAFQSAAWTVHNDCNEDIYIKIRKTDLAPVMYIGGYEEAHVLTIGGETVDLVKGEDNQYVAHNVSLSAGDTVTSYTIEGNAVAVTSKKVANNNLDENKKIIADVASADIYYNVETKTLWISGLPAAGQHILKNGNAVIEMHHTDPYEGYDQYASGLLSFAANDTIKLVNTGKNDSYADIWCPGIIKTSSKLAGKFIYDSENHQMKCVTACNAAVYLKIKSGVDEVYFGDVPEYVEEAVEFANGFKSAMQTACSAAEKKDAVESAWALQAAAFEALSEQAQNEIKNQLSIVDEIIEFTERYIAIKQQHSSWNLANFLDWDIPINPAFAHGSLYVDVDHSTTIIVVISIAVASAIALSALLILKKKRKHD